MLPLLIPTLLLLLLLLLLKDWASEQRTRDFLTFPLSCSALAFRLRAAWFCPWRIRDRLLLLLDDDSAADGGDGDVARDGAGLCCCCCCFPSVLLLPLLPPPVALATSSEYEDIDVIDAVSARSGRSLCWKISIACFSSFRADRMCLSRIERSPVVRSKKLTRDSYRLRRNFSCGSGPVLLDTGFVAVAAAAAEPSWPLSLGPVAAADVGCVFVCSTFSVNHAKTVSNNLRSMDGDSVSSNSLFLLLVVSLLLLFVVVVVLVVASEVRPWIRVG
mmetsp:Transcript_29378/g.63005  ORF Transcript_29378/g.63005 Transcript_29378/m.63005 type:complete len:274 (+) Transcript_29378:1464-2285(+)